MLKTIERDILKKKKRSSKKVGLQGRSELRQGGGRSHIIGGGIPH